MSSGTEDKARTTAPRKPPLPGQRLVSCLLKTLALVCVLYAVLFGIFIVADVMSPSLTATITPPTYPNTTIIRTESWHISAGIRQTTIYQTMDSREPVRAYYAAYMPDLQLTMVVPEYQEHVRTEGYASQQCNEQVLAYIVGHILSSSPFGHCAKVAIYQDAQSGTTIIEVTTWRPTSL